MLHIMRDVRICFKFIVEHAVFFELEADSMIGAEVCFDLAMHLTYVILARMTRSNERATLWGKGGM